MIPFVDLKAQYKDIKDEIRDAIDDVLESQWFILGPKVSELEDIIARYCGVKYAIGVASGSDALLLSLMAIGVGVGDEVITTPFTFFATAGAISRLGATPVFVDIDRWTYNIDPKLIEAKITVRTKAIIPVHLYGQCVDMNPVLDLAKRHGLYVIEDAAQAMGAIYRGKPAGSMGNLGCLSFFPTKNLGGYGDGGMILTNDEDFAEEVRMLRVHGSKPKYYHSAVGCNSRLDAIRAAVLLVKIKHLGYWNRQRRWNAERYDCLFGSRVITPLVESFNYHVYNQYVISVDNRDALREFLKAGGVSTEVYYPIPLHRQECYSGLGYKRGDMPVAEEASRRVLALPVYAELTQEQQQCIVKLVGEFIC